MNTAHLLIAFLVLCGGLDQFFILRLKRVTDPGARLRVYRTIMSWLWVATMAAAWIFGPRALWYAHLNPSDIRWVPSRLVILIVTVVSILAILAPLIIVWAKPNAAASIARAVEKLRFFLPQTAKERLWWALLSITAGFCEETLFRSFLLQYLHVNPWRLGLGAAVFVACALFALGHLYQGVVAACATGVLALLFFVLFLGSGSLLLPIVLHAIIDLRALLILRLAESASA